MDILSILPGSSFVPFSVSRLANPNVAWENREEDCSVDVMEHAFCAPIEDEPASAFSAESREYFAERYGGRGVGPNGGGARCGTRGLVQIKGIGKAPLVGGKSHGAEHSYGGASLQEAVREALWGEICHIALPFGAVRSFGIIKTGTDVRNFGFRDSIVMTPRALVLREPALRPAHFMRAPYFVPQVLSDISDVERTRAAIAILPSVLWDCFRCGGASSGGAAGVADCLMELSRRFAWQQAAAQAKRLIHGALSSTNIALDGRWLDFGTIGMASDYGRAVVSVQPDAWLQFTALLDPLQELIFHLRKYLPTGASDLPTAKDVVQSYLGTLAVRLRYEFVKLIGIPETALPQLPPALIERFAVCVQRIIAGGNRYTFDLYERRRPAKSGRFHLNTLLRIAALTDSIERTELDLMGLMPDEPLRQEFVESYWALRLAYIQARNGSEHTGATHLTLNAIRVNTIIDELCRPVLDDRIERLVADGQSIMNFIASLVRKVRTFLAEPKYGVVDIDAFYEGNGATKYTKIGLYDDVGACVVLDSLPKHYFGYDQKGQRLVVGGERT